MESSKGFFRGSLAVPWKKLDFHSHFDGSSSFFGLETAGNRNQLPVRFVQPLWAFLVSWMMTWQVMETKATFEFAENTRIGQLNFTQSGWARLRWYPALIPHHFIGVASNLLWPSLILLHFDSFFAHVLLTKGPGTLSVRIFSRTGYEETKWVLDSNHTSQKHHFLDKCWFIPHERRPILLFFSCDREAVGFQLFLAQDTRSSWLRVGLSTQEAGGKHLSRLEGLFRPPKMAKTFRGFGFIS